MARMKCPLCGTSTAIADGYCEFCGSRLPGVPELPVDEARARRALEAEASGAPAGVAALAPPPSQADRLAEIAFLLAIVSIFIAGIAAPVAWFLGRKARRELEAEERKNWMAGAAEVIGMVVTGLLVLGVAVAIYMFAVVVPRAMDMQMREMERQRQEVQDILDREPAVPPAP